MSHRSWPGEDGNLKRVLALILALAALLVFAPVARADIEGGAHPYWDIVSPAADGVVVTPADDDGDDDDEDDDDEDERSGDDDEDEDDEDEDDEGSEDDDSSDDDEGSTNNPPGDNNQQPTGPSTSAIAGGVGSWLWLLLIAIAAIAAGTAYVLRVRRNR